MNPFLATDGYKVGHHKMYPEGTTKVYSNFTPRSNKYAPKGCDKVVSFGQQMVMRQIKGMFDLHFFKKDITSKINGINPLDVKNEVCQEIKKEYSLYLGEDYDISHIEAIWDLGYLPIEVKALPEGTTVPMGVPVLTIVNTKPEFFWLTNFLETLISNLLWKPMTSATLAYQFKKDNDRWIEETDKGNEIHRMFGCHDFSMRGMDSIDATISSGLGHAVSFMGSDSLPVIHGARKFYGETEGVVHSVNGTEHSVMCAGTKGDEIGTFRYLMEQFPTGILSIVSDTWDLWKVLTEYLPELKEEILARDGKIVIRPDCYSDDTSVLTKDGWKLFKDLNKNKDLVAQVLDDGSYEFVKPSKYVNEHYQGDMIHFTDSFGKIDLLVTPNHRMVYDNGSGNFQVQEAKYCNFNWKKDIRRSALAPNLGKELSPIEALKIAFQADGSYQSTGNKIRFSFSKQRKIERLEGILKDCNINYKIYTLKDGRVEFNIDVDGSNFDKDFGWVNTTTLCSNWCQEFIEELSYWDATRRHDKRFKFDTTTKNVIEVVEYIAMSAGYGILIKEREDTRKSQFSNVFTAHILKDNKLGGQSIKKKIVNYDGNIVCVTVPTGRLVVKRGSGQLVCGNSGDPVDIICGLNSRRGCWMKEEEGKYYYSDNGLDLNQSEVKKGEQKGVVELLWDVFGGTINEQGYKVLNPKIGAIYGDSINLERFNQINKRLQAKGFASTNWVAGIGSFTYQFNTRDTFGFAMKATYVEVDENCVCHSTKPNFNTLDHCGICDGKRTLIKGREIFKDPITDDGTKKSAKGLLRVETSENGYKLEDQQTWEGEKSGSLQTIFKNGKFKNEVTLTEIRNKLNS